MITVAPAGTRVAPDALVRAARAWADLGAAIVHLPAQRDDGAVAALREATDLIIRVAAGVEAGPDAAGCPLDSGWDAVVELHTRLRELRIVPAYEVVEPGQLVTLRRLLDEHGPPFGGHVHCDLLLGRPGGLPGTVPALAAALADLPEGATFAAAGTGPSSLPVMLAALAADGHLRVGMQHTDTYGPGEPVRTDAQLVARAVGLARIAQRPPMPVEEARALLGVADRRPVRT